MAHKMTQKDEKTTMMPNQQGEVLPHTEHPIERMFGRMFEDFWRRPVADRLAKEGVWPFTGLRASHPMVDLYDEGEALMMKVEVPGLTKEDLELQISDHVLTIRGEKKKEEKIEEQDYYRCERTFGVFSRMVQLPTSVMVDKVTATFKNGVLEVRLPKSEDAKKKETRINIA